MKTTNISIDEKINPNDKTIENDINDIVKEDSNEVKLKGDKKSVENKKTQNSNLVIADEFLPGNFNPFEKKVNPKFNKFPKKSFEKEFDERIISIKRVIKVTKGGRRFKFSALVVVGDKKGKVGYAFSKHIEVPEAIKNALRLAKKNLQDVKISGKQDTISHEVIGKHGSARVLLKPAVEGKGIIASDVVRSVVELAGIRNIYSKNLGTNNPQNVIIATLEGLSRLKTKEEIEFLRNKKIDDKILKSKSSLKNNKKDTNKINKSVNQGRK